jgi:hypothetical protein
MKPELLTSVAKDQLNLVLSFFSRVDAKASVVLGVDTAMAGYLAVRMPSLKTMPGPWGRPWGQTGRFRRLGSRVFVFEFLSIHFDAHAFLLVGNLFEGSNVVSGTLLQPFVAGNHDSSSQ